MCGLANSPHENQMGTCSTKTRRISLNLELTEKPVQCLEYIVSHELVHLIERRHNDLFVSMNGHLPHGDCTASC